MRIREAKEEFQSYYRGTTPPDHENEWVDTDEKSIFKRIAFFEWACRAAPDLRRVWREQIYEFCIGGKEHLVFSTGSQLYKLTIAPIFGRCVDLDEECVGLAPCQDPERYLDRFVAMEEIWGFQTQFLGVIGDKTSYSILIQQDWIAGERATVSEIRQHMFELGFRELQHSFGYRNSLSFYNDEFGVFDLRPANVVKMIEGIIIPIDCFVERLDPKKIQVLESL